MEPPTPPVFHTLREFRAHRSTNLAAYPTLGCVLTMGSLHKGHLSIIATALEAHPAVVVSVFVNPAQFAPGEDFDAYPRSLQNDLSLIAETHRAVRPDAAVVVLAPKDAELYPEGFGTYLDVSCGAAGVNPFSEGASRPTFFRGVATVCCKFFNIIRPSVAYFGQKDAQQCAVIKQLVRDLEMPLEISIVPTVREESGLAMSSRNAYLSETERSQATVIYRMLCTGREAFQNGERSGDKIRELMLNVAAETIVPFDLQYVSLCSASSMREVEGQVEGSGDGFLLAVAGYFGKTRLIDNMYLE